MALGRYTRIDNRRQSSSYISTLTIGVLVTLVLVAAWMFTSPSEVPGQNVDLPAQEKKNDANEKVTDSNENNSQQFKDSPGDLPDDATKGYSNESTSQGENKEGKPMAVSNDGLNTETHSGENNTQDEDSKMLDDEINSKAGGTKRDERESNGAGQGNPLENATENKSDSGESGTKPDLIETETKPDADETNNKSEDSDDGKKEVTDGLRDENNMDQKDNKESEQSTDGKDNNQIAVDMFPSGAQPDLLNETTARIGNWATQASESKNEKESQVSSEQKGGYNWKLCNSTAGPDYIPCLDNLKAIKSLRSTKHYEHRERHCPEDPPTCLVPLPLGYQIPIPWPKSREKVWYNNVPHTKLAKIKGHQNWVKVTGEYLTFPGGGTQFKHGALHYIDFINESVPAIAWGKRSRVILDVGCGVASFGGYLFDRDVLTMSLAPKDEHEAQVQFALERGIPAISAVMGTKRLPYPSIVFDIVHCARCRVPWHIEGGKLLLELNRVLRPGGFFVWSATPVYKKLDEDVEIWKAMTELTKAMCWELVSVKKDKLNGIGVATYRKPTSNECYEKRVQQAPPMCEASDDANAAWNVPLQSCMHKVPVKSEERGSQWPEQWPSRLDKAPYWMLSSQVGVYGKPAPDDFTADYEHWKLVVSNSYLKGIGINWVTVRNVMDMNAIYGGFAAALRDLNVWVMNVVSVNSADTLPIIYERGLFGVYHDWCESFSTYPRSYDLLHADHLFSQIKKRCNLVAVVAEVDRILRPEGKLIVRDKVETINELENMVRSMQWEVRMTFEENDEGLLSVQKSMWRPSEWETLTYA